MSDLQSSQQLLKVIRLSELIDDFQLQRAFRDFESTGIQSASGLARFLIDLGLLTDWQAGKLLENKFKGFFRGPYVFLDCRESTQEIARYLVRHGATGRLLMMKVYPSAPKYLARDWPYEIEEL